MNKKIGFTKLKTAIIIFSAATILGVPATFIYYNQRYSKNVNTSAKTPESTTTPQVTQSPKLTPPPQATESLKPIKQPETRKSSEPTAEANSGNLTSDKAVEIVKNIVTKNGSDTKAAFDHIQKRDGQNYYVIRLYESMPDHSATLGWFYVQVDTGKAFEWDLTYDKLTPIN